MAVDTVPVDEKRAPSFDSNEKKAPSVDSDEIVNRVAVDELYDKPSKAPIVDLKAAALSSNVGDVYDNVRAIDLGADGKERPIGEELHSHCDGSALLTQRYQRPTWTTPSDLSPLRTTRRCPSSRSVCGCWRWDSPASALSSARFS